MIDQAYYFVMYVPHKRQIRYKNNYLNQSFFSVFDKNMGEMCGIVLNSRACLSSSILFTPVDGKIFMLLYNKIEPAIQLSNRW